MMRFTKIFSLMLLSLGSAGLHAQLATVDLLAKETVNEVSRKKETDYSKVFGWKKSFPKSLDEYREELNNETISKQKPVEKLSEKQLVAKAFNQQIQDKKSKLYDQLKNVAVGYGGPDGLIRFQDQPQVIAESDILEVGSESGKYRSSTSYLVRINQYSELGASDSMNTPKFFRVNIDTEYTSGGPNQGEVSSQSLTIDDEVKLVSAKPSPGKFLNETEAGSGKSSH